MNRKKSNSKDSKRDKTVTRSTAKENPELSKQVLDNFSSSSNIWKRSNKTPRSPPSKRFNERVQEAEQSNTNIQSQTTTSNVNIEADKESNIFDSIENIISKLGKSSTSKNEETFTENDNTSFQINESTEINNQDYSDIGGIAGEQNLLLDFNNGNDTSLDKLNVNNTNSNTSDIEKNKQDSLNLNNPKLSKFNESNYKLAVVTPEKINKKYKMEKNLLKLEIKDMADLLPEFNGYNIPSMDIIRRLREIKPLVANEDEKSVVIYIKMKFTGQAHKSLASSDAVTFDDLIKAIKTVFPTRDNIHILYGELSQIYQKEDETVVQYTNRLKDLVLQIKELKKSETIGNEGLAAYNQTVDYDAKRYFKEGLKFEIRADLKDLATLEDLSLEAIKIESRKNKNKALRNTLSSVNCATAETFNLNQQKVLICQICKDFNHEALFCKIAACVYCKSADHFSNSCKFVKKKINLICRYCSQPGHSISCCVLNDRQGNHCQYCQEMGHEVGQCPFIVDYELCWKCKESGHNPNLCPNKIHKLEYCEYCGTHGHDIQNCSEVICQKCNQRGHTIKTCTAGDERTRFCAFCEESGHDQDGCDRIKVLITQHKNKQQLKCQICDNVGHTAKNCYKLQNSQRSQNFNNRFNQNRNNFTNTYNKNVNKNYQGFNTRTDNINQRKRCEYCSAIGHSIEECRKMQAVQNYERKEVQTQCSFCKNNGHTIDSCFKLKSLESKIDKFCNLCKNIGHTADTCYKNRIQQQNSTNEQIYPGNDCTLPGGSV